MTVFRQYPTDKKSFLIAYIAVATALLFVLSLFDSIFNFGFGVPGVKVGLSNIVVIFFISNFSFLYSFLIVIIKIFINTFFISGFSAFLFTAAGSLTSFFAMCLIRNTLKEKVSCIGISVAGGLFHIIMQYVMSALILKTLAVFHMMPYALMLTCGSSVIVGIICNFIINIKRSVFLK